MLLDTKAHGLWCYSAWSLVLGSLTMCTQSQFVLGSPNCSLVPGLPYEVYILLQPLSFIFIFLHQIRILVYK